MKDRDSLFGLIVNGRSCTRTPDLTCHKRAINPENGNLMPHAVFRHRDFGSNEPTWSDGNKFGQGSRFPKNIKPGDITRIQKAVRSEYTNYLKGKTSRLVSDPKPAGGAYRITVELNKYGVSDVGAFNRDGQVITVFPE